MQRFTEIYMFVLTLGKQTSYKRSSGYLTLWTDRSYDK